MPMGIHLRLWWQSLINGLSAWPWGPLHGGGEQQSPPHPKKQPAPVPFSCILLSSELPAGKSKPFVFFSSILVIISLSIPASPFHPSPPGHLSCPSPPWKLLGFHLQPWQGSEGTPATRISSMGCSGWGVQVSVIVQVAGRGSGAFWTPWLVDT